MNSKDLLICLGFLYLGKMKRGKSGNLVISNLVFIILNLVFLAMLMAFLFLKTGNGADMEESYSKQIALMIDASRPVMEIEINMEEVFDKLEDGWKKEEVVKIEGNVVTVSLREKGGHSYSFFNDVYVGKPYVQGEDYVFVINEKNVGGIE